MRKFRSIDLLSCELNADSYKPTREGCTDDKLCPYALPLAVKEGRRRFAEKWMRQTNHYPKGSLLFPKSRTPLNHRELSNEKVITNRLELIGTKQTLELWDYNTSSRKSSAYKKAKVVSSKYIMLEKHTMPKLYNPCPRPNKWSSMESTHEHHERKRDSLLLRETMIVFDKDCVPQHSNYATPKKWFKRLMKLKSKDASATQSPQTGKMDTKILQHLERYNPKEILFQNHLKIFRTMISKLSVKAIQNETPRCCLVKAYNPKSYHVEPRMTTTFDRTKNKVIKPNVRVRKLPYCADTAPTESQFSPWETD